jgi:NAD(P)H-dependent FMN reductase
MEEKIVIAVLAGTTRPLRESIKAAHYVADIGRTFHNVEIIFVDPADFAFPNDGEDPGGKDPRYSEITKRADAFFIVTPEYNHGYPSSLKRMIDSEYANYKHKPVAMAGASNGQWGGVRVCEALLPVLHRTGMIIIQPEVYFPRVQDMFDGSGSIKPEFSERQEKNIRASYAELLWFAHILKPARAANL